MCACVCVCVRVHEINREHGCAMAYALLYMRMQHVGLAVHGQRQQRWMARVRACVDERVRACTCACVRCLGVPDKRQLGNNEDE